MKNITCPCGNTYTPVADEETVGIPPSYTAKQFFCDACRRSDWIEPHDLGLFSWEELEDPIDDPEEEILTNLAYTP